MTFEKGTEIQNGKKVVPFYSISFLVERLSYSSSPGCSFSLLDYLLSLFAEGGQGDRKEEADEALPLDQEPLQAKMANADPAGGAFSPRKFFSFFQDERRQKQPRFLSFPLLLLLPCRWVPLFSYASMPCF